MPKFVPKALSKLQHTAPKKPQHSSHKHVVPGFGQQQQFTPALDKSPVVNKETTQYIQSIVGSFIYYGRVVDPTILPTINELGII